MHVHIRTDAHPCSLQNRPRIFIIFGKTASLLLLSHDGAKTMDVFFACVLQGEPGTVQGSSGDVVCTISALFSEKHGK